MFFLTYLGPAIRDEPQVILAPPQPHRRCQRRALDHIRHSHPAVPCSNKTLVSLLILRVSRACLGKMIVFMLQMAHTCVHKRRAPHRSLSRWSPRACPGLSVPGGDRPCTSAARHLLAKNAALFLSAFPRLCLS